MQIKAIDIETDKELFINTENILTLEKHRVSIEYEFCFEVNVQFKGESSIHRYVINKFLLQEAGYDIERTTEDLIDEVRRMEEDGQFDEFDDDDIINY